ncbi:MAG: ABC transporter ATP-binding protein [Planctomycetota bacterium]|jgi:putative ABC transport system ATP-binding protein
MVHLQKVSKVFRTRGGQVRALDEVNLDVQQGQFLVIRGQSGSGKTTLLLTIGGMLSPTSGIVSVDGCDIYTMGTRQRAGFRADNIGFVFQMFHLVPYLTVIENVVLSVQGSSKKNVRTEAGELLERLGLSARGHHKPPELSAGERQRVAIARATLSRPKIILADEPTGNLDPQNAAQVVEGLAMFHRSGGTVIVVTHGTPADKYADRIIRLKDGRIQEPVEKQKS